MQIVQRTLPDVLGSASASVASLTKTLDIPRDRWIRRMILKQHIQYDTGASAPSLNEDNPFSNVPNLRLVAGMPGGTKDTLIDSSLASLARMNTFDYGHELPKAKTTTSTSQSNQTVDSEVVLDFAQVPRNKWDMSALIPARYLSSLQLSATFGADSTLGTNTTTDFSYLTVTLEEVIFDSGEEQKLFGSKFEKLMKVYHAEQEKTIDATYSNYQFKWDLPVSDILQKMLITSYDNSIRAETICSAWKVRREAGGGTDLYQTDWLEGQYLDVLENGTEFAERESGANVGYKGVSVYDPSVSQYANINGAIVGGLDLRGAKSGDYAFRANTGSPTATSKFKFLTRSVAPF